MMHWIKELSMTAAIGVGLGELIIYVSSGWGTPIPSHPTQRPVFIIGTLLFSLVFRLFWSLKEEAKNS